MCLGIKKEHEHSGTYVSVKYKPYPRHGVWSWCDFSFLLIFIQLIPKTAVGRILRRSLCAVSDWIQSDSTCVLCNCSEETKQLKELEVVTPRNDLTKCKSLPGGSFSLFFTIKRTINKQQQIITWRNYTNGEYTKQNSYNGSIGNALASNCSNGIIIEKLALAEHFYGFLFWKKEINTTWNGKMMGCLSRLVAAAIGAVAVGDMCVTSRTTTRMPHFKVVFIFCPPGLWGDISLQVFSSSSSWFSWDIDCAVRCGEASPPRKFIVNRIICHEWYEEGENQFVIFQGTLILDVYLNICLETSLISHSHTHKNQNYLSQEAKWFNFLLVCVCDDGNICFSKLSIRVVQSRHGV